MLPARVTPGESVICQKVKDEAILLDMSTQQYFGLNNTGAQMWELLVTLGKPDQVVASMEQDYTVAKAILQADLEKLVNELLAAGLLRVS